MDGNELIENRVYVDEFGHKHRLVKELSRGGQGAVFRTDQADILVKLAIKQGRTIPAAAGDDYMNIRLLPIDQKTNVTMPLVLLKEKSGYVMQFLMDMQSFSEAFGSTVDMSEELKAEIDNIYLKKIAEEGSDQVAGFLRTLISNGGVRRIIQAYLMAALTLSKLHATGLVYCDFSPNNVFVSSDRAFCHVWLIDADNLGFQEDTAQRIVYTPGIGAPELVSEEEGCSIYADCYAFAASLFRQLTKQHHFEGTAYLDTDEFDDLDEKEMAKDCGYFPWLYDSDDDSNEPLDAGLSKLCLSAELMGLFKRTFDREKGVSRKIWRPVMWEWMNALAHSMDTLVRCPICGMDYYANNDSGDGCTWCGQVSQIMIIKSYYARDKKPDELIWEWYHEYNGHDVSIPMRIVHGLIAEDLDNESVFLTFSRHKDGLLLKKSIEAENIKCQFMNDSQKWITSSSFITRNKNFHIYCDDEEYGLNIIIEGEIQDGN